MRDRKKIRCLKTALSVFTSILVIDFCFANPAITPVSYKDTAALSLAGQWSFKLDPDNVELKEKWYCNKLSKAVKLPGTLDEQGLSYKTNKRDVYRLTPEYQYVGQVWYQKEITIPSDWENKRISLFLERCHWETRVWVDGDYVDMQNSLSVPHIYNLTDWLKPGKHTLTLCVDNAVKINIGSAYGDVQWSHAITEETQTNWNGIIGRIELIATPKVWIESVQVYPDFDKKTTKVTIVIGNITGQSVEGKLNMTDLPDNTSINNIPFKTIGEKTLVEAEMPFSKYPTFWDEFSPILHELKVELFVTSDSQKYTDTHISKFGLRDFRIDGQHFKLNDRTIFLRGNVDCCVFPLTGYPPMTTKGWKDYLGIFKNYGMNHIRFHSWCPPEAAFQAADELGFIFQIEPPFWDGHGLVGDDKERAKYILDEAKRIVDTYGNHPSFCLMSMGNELGDGSDPYLAYMIDYLKKKDSRHFYTSTTHPSSLARKDDYFVSAATEKGGVRGDIPFRDFRDSLQGYDRPLIAHEVAQPAMYPDYNEIDKYTGNLKARNLEIFRENLKQKGMLDQADDFRRASGALLVALYKENIEAQLRTPNVAGFQLLGLQDYPGHGTALIGVLDAFCDSKGLITLKAFRRFCSPTVPLIIMKGFVWTNNETFTASAEVAHYGPIDLKNQPAIWSINNADGIKIASGNFDSMDIPTGKTTELGEIKFELNKVDVPAKLTVEISLPGTKSTNSWEFWVYPEKVETAISENVLVSNKWDKKTKEALQQGYSVVLFPSKKTLIKTESARWHPVFWSYQLFRQPEMMGILCDPNHPVFADFVTDVYSDWQWYDLLQNSEALLLDGIDEKIRPVVQFVPDFVHNKKMSAILEANVGTGRMIVCTIDLQTNIETRPVARQLFHSLVNYAQSDAFAPERTLTIENLDELLKTNPFMDMDMAPKHLEKAALNIRAAATAPINQPSDWAANFDNVITKTSGFGYQVKGKIWRDGRGSAWYENHLVVDITCPVDFEGSFYAHFHDWDGQNRSAALFFTGRDMGPLPRYDGKGIWVEIPVTKEMTADGRLNLDARCTGGPNVVISQIVLIPKE